MKLCSSIFTSFTVFLFWNMVLFSAESTNLVPNPSFEKVTLSIPPINFLPARPANENDPLEYKVNIPDGWKIVSAYARGYLPGEQGWGVAEKAHTGNRSIFLSYADNQDYFVQSFFFWREE